VITQILKPELARDVRYAAILRRSAGLDAAVKAGLDFGVQAGYRAAIVVQAVLSNPIFVYLNHQYRDVPVIGFYFSPARVSKM
jgi:hypothetical protein